MTMNIISRCESGQNLTCLVSTASIHLYSDAADGLSGVSHGGGAAQLLWGSSDDSEALHWLWIFILVIL